MMSFMLVAIIFYAAGVFRCWNKMIEMEKEVEDETLRLLRTWKQNGPLHPYRG